MNKLLIKDDIFWVGALDFESRDFHGYSRSPEGTSYNSYLMKDEKNVLFDTVKSSHFPFMKDRLQRIMPLESIDYIVVSHAEPDHGGCLAAIVDACKPEAVFCSPMGLKSIQGHSDCANWPLRVVKTGDRVSAGRRTIQFMEARMLHWPDSMLSYIPEEKLLISNDVFGQNIAGTERFTDELDRHHFLHALCEYYYNIILPYSAQALRMLDELQSPDMPIDMIAPDHGFIIRGSEEVAFVLKLYREFALQAPQNRALILYDTMWRSTEHMAHAIQQGLAEAGTHAMVMNLKQNHHSAIMTELSRCGLLAIGSPTHNNGVLPAVAGTLAYIKGLKPKNRLGAAFGSFGWSGEAPGIISEWFTSLGFEQPIEAIKVQFTPTEETLRTCRARGVELAAALQKKCAGYQAPD